MKLGFAGVQVRCRWHAALLHGFD